MKTVSKSDLRVYVVILNWNRYEHTKKCIESLQGNVYPTLRLVIVDNASADQSGKRLSAEFPQHSFIFNESNVGFARGCNVGIRAALEDGQCAYVLLINNDATLTTHGLDKAVAAAEGDRRIGLLGGKILHSPESRTIWYAGGSINLWRGQVNTRGSRETDRGQYDEACDVGFVTGGLMLIRRDVFDTIGLLPEEYFFGVEEWDYSLAARKAGFTLRYVPELVAYHKGDGSHWNYDPKFVYNFYRNKLLFQEKYLPRGLFPIWMMLFAIYGKYWARSERRKLIERNQYDVERPVPLDDLDFALAEALKDHKRDTLSEEALDRFEERLRERKRHLAASLK